MKRRLLITDMDHTLLNSQSQIDPVNLAAIRRHVEAGGLYTVATGRAPAAIRIFPELLPYINLPVITGNGGQVVDLTTNEVLYRKTLPLGAEELIAAAMVEFPEMGAVAYCGLDGFYLFQRNLHTDDLVQREGRPALACTIGESPKPWNKALMTSEHAYMVAVGEWLAPRLEGMGRLVFSEDTYLELLPTDASKGAAMGVMLARAGISPDQVVAMGDAPNDIEMLQAAGVGVAVGNADQSVKAVADAVVGDHNGPAVQECIQRFLMD